MRTRVAVLLGRHYTYPVWNRIVEVAAIGVYAVYAGLVVDQTLTGAFTLESAGQLDLATALSVVPVALLALLAADFVSGFVHCAADNFGDENTPVFGVAIIRPFRDHHRDPLGITRHDFVETNGNSCLANLVVLVPTLHLVDKVAPSGATLLLQVAVLAFTTAIVLTNQIHKWAHLPQPPRVIAMLQRLGMILSPENHAVHHTVPFDKHYCITTGWMNGLTEKTGFFAWLVRTFK